MGSYGCYRGITGLLLVRSRHYTGVIIGAMKEMLGRNGCYGCRRGITWHHMGAGKAFHEALSCEGGPTWGVLGVGLSRSEEDLTVIPHYAAGNCHARRLPSVRMRRKGW